MKVAIYTLGCKVNLYESEFIMNEFKDRGYKLVNFNQESDIYIINSCTVTNNADIKTRKAVNKIKKNHPNSILVLIGCYPQTNKDDTYEDIDIILGNKNKSKIVNIVEKYIEDKNKFIDICDLSSVPFEKMNISKFNTRTRAFIKIQDGCNNYCSYCIIPYARGTIRSKDMSEIIKEVHNLVDNGYKEIVLTGIHTGHFGKETGIVDLSDLLISLSNISELKRIRLSSIEITEIDDKFLSCLKNIDKFSNHLHIPIQSGCNKTLKDMNRKYDLEYFKNKIKEIRKIRPDISITTDLIVGFPNETEEDFNNTIETLKDIEFSKIHVFPFSKRNGTLASKMENQIDSVTKKKRVKEIIELSKMLEIKYMESFIGKSVDVLIEKNENNYLIGYTSNYLLAKIPEDISKLNTIKKHTIKNIKYPYVI